VEGQGALNALDMDFRSCSFDCARSRPAKTIKSTKKAAYIPTIKNSPQSLARRLASPLFLPGASSYNEILTVAQLDRADAACAKADATCPDEGFYQAAPLLSTLRLLFPPRPPTNFCAGTAPKPIDGAAGRDETPAAHSVPTKRATTTWTKRRARPSRVHTKSTGATSGAKAARGKAVRAGAEAGAGAGG